MLPLVAAATCFYLVSAVAPAQEEDKETPEVAPYAGGPGEAISPPPAAPAAIRAPVLSEQPQEGKGRMEIVLGGNRRWCTFPDDRVVRPREKPGMRASRKTEVFTFGYKFTVVAVKRGAADATLMLYESPVFRTASWRPAFKLGLDHRTQNPGPKIISEGDGPGAPGRKPGPHTLVPYWQDQHRCVTLPSRMDFDLDPGAYDVYVAFDLLMRDGSWVHRTSGFLTDVPIQAARRTRVDGIANLASGNEREVELLTSALLPAEGAAEAVDR